MQYQINHINVKCSRHHFHDKWSPKFFRILTFGASACLGGMYGANKCLGTNSPSSQGTRNGVGGVIYFTFSFLLHVWFPHVVSEGPRRSTTDFMDVLIGQNETFSKKAGAYCHGGIYPDVSSMIGVGDAVRTSKSKVELALEIEIAMLQ